MRLGLKLFRTQLDREAQLHGGVGSIIQSVSIEASHDEGWFVCRRLWFQDQSDAIVCIALNVLQQKRNCTIEIAPVRGNKVHVLSAAGAGRRFSRRSARARLRKLNEDAHC